MRKIIDKCNLSSPLLWRGTGGGSRVVLLFLLFSLTASGQSFTALWKEYTAAQEKDLPQTQLTVLRKIEAKAEKEKAFPHLLKSLTTQVEVTQTLAPDSIEQLKARFLDKAENCPDKAAAAILNLAIHKGARTFGIKDSKPYLKKAFADKDFLAGVKTDGWKDIVEVNADSEVFGHNLLSLMAFEADETKMLLAYYRRDSLSTESKRAQAVILYRQQGDITRQTVERYKDVPEGALLAYKFLESQQHIFSDENSDKARCDSLFLLLKEYQGVWKGSPYASYLDNIEKTVLRSETTLQVGEKMLLPGTPHTAKLANLHNIGEMTVTIVPLNVKGRDIPSKKWNDNAYFKNILKSYATRQGSGYKGERVIKKTLTQRQPYITTTDSIELPALPIGVYYMKVEADTQKKDSFTVDKSRSTLTDEDIFYVSGLQVLRLPLPGKKFRTVVVDAANGHEVKGAQIATTGEEHNSRFCAYTKDDNAMPYLQIFSSRFNASTPAETDEQLNIFTDRSIYRPGQTVRVAGIYHKISNGRATETMPDAAVTLTIRDANGKALEEKTTRTDEYGTFAADFLLPANVLTGWWCIDVQKPYPTLHRIRVEEYKRPTFEVSFEPYTKDYRLGDTITVKGSAKTYAGVPVANGKVTCDVQRTKPWWFWWWGGNDNTVIVAKDTLTTDDNGDFFVMVPLTPDNTGKSLSPMSFTFKLSATVKNIAGESHEGSHTLTASNTAVMLKASIDDKVLKGSPSKLAVAVRNGSGKEIADAKISILLDGKGKAYPSVSEAETAIGALSSGSHSLTAKCEVNGREYADTVMFHVFSLDDKRPVMETPKWFYATADRFTTPDDVVTVQFGSSLSDVEVFYDVFVGDEHKESSVLHCSNSLIRKDFRCTDAEKSILVVCAWMKDGKLYRSEHLIQNPLPEKKMELKWKTFRDRLEPGQKEEWTLNASMPSASGKEKGCITLLAAMYDKSLDALCRHSFGVSLGMRAQSVSTHWNDGYSSLLYLHPKKFYKTSKTKDLLLSAFNVWPFSFNNFIYSSARVYNTLATRSMSKSAMRLGANSAAPMAMADMAAYGVEVEEAKSAGDIRIQGSGKSGDAGAEDGAQQTVAARSNFSETAFFHPQLMADEQGDISIKFTLPESTTTWRLYALAHDKQMNNGILSEDVIAQKQLMITPNMPRFLRESDEAVLSSVVSNLTDKSVTAKSTLYILDAATLQTLATESKTVSVEANKTAAVDFNLPLPSSINKEHGGVIVKITAETDSHSDGEQRFLPILSDTEPLLTTRVITMVKPGKETVNTADLFPADATDRTLTVEWTENPAHLLLEALPYLSAQDQTTSYAQAAAYYANTVAKHIVGKAGFPKELLQKDGKTNKSALSESLMAQFPNSAQREGEEVSLAKFYDENTLQYNQEQLLRKLKDSQTSEGGWSWCPQMHISYHITSQICELLVRLNNMTGETEPTKQMLGKALKCLQGKAHEEIEQMRKEEKKGITPYINDGYALQYVYLKALAGASLNAQERADAAYLIKYLKKQERKNSLYMKAKLAIVLHYMGEKSIALEYLKSIKEYSVYQELQGRYFDSPRAAYSWRDYRQPTQTMVIEALHLITPADKQTVSEMQRWLLMQKRTQAWDTPINTVNNVYAFMLPSTSGDGAAADGGNLAAIAQPSGYRTSTDTGADIRPQYSFEKTSDNVSWGAVFAHYRQKAANVSAHSQGLAITREVVREGDRAKVVITVTADRDYDFVQIVDKRAACLEPISQLSRYTWGDSGGYYIAPQDSRTLYFFNMMRKGRHVITTEYYIDRKGNYHSGTCSAQCAYAPEFYGVTGPNAF